MSHRGKSCKSRQSSRAPVAALIPLVTLVGGIGLLHSSSLSSTPGDAEHINKK